MERFWKAFKVRPPTRPHRVFIACEDDLKFYLQVWFGLVPKRMERAKKSSKISERPKGLLGGTELSEVRTTVSLPGGNTVTEEKERWYNSSWIELDHGAQTATRVLLFDTVTHVT